MGTGTEPRASRARDLARSPPVSTTVLPCTELLLPALTSAATEGQRGPPRFARLSRRLRLSEAAGQPFIQQTFAEAQNKGSGAQGPRPPLVSPWKDGVDMASKRETGQSTGGWSGPPTSLGPAPRP